MCDPRAICFIALGLEIEKSQRRALLCENGMTERRKRLEGLLDTFGTLQQVYMPPAREQLPATKPYALPEKAMVILPSSLRAAERAKCAVGLAETELAMREEQCEAGRSRLECLTLRRGRLLDWGKKRGAGSRSKNAAELVKLERAIGEERGKLDDATAALLRLRNVDPLEQKPDEGAVVENAPRAAANARAPSELGPGRVLSGSGGGTAGGEDGQSAAGGGRVPNITENAPRAAANARAPSELGPGRVLSGSGGGTAGREDGRSAAGGGRVPNITENAPRAAANARAPSELGPGRV
ncbi:hypothetical protein C8R43DRAFT_1137479 [Mycena crocata]|nr:hypothetical protein C8R43DRAFT_1137479 [Mycena crocata]